MFQTSLAQSNRDSVSTLSLNSIEVRSLVGVWTVEDVAHSIIEFIDSTVNDLTLDLKNGYHPYYFLKDRQNRVSVSGFYPNWPPFYCTLKLIDATTLEIEFSQLGVPTSILRCRKATLK